jgi:hypothetical protein
MGIPAAALVVGHCLQRDLAVRQLHPAVGSAGVAYCTAGMNLAAAALLLQQAEVMQSMPWVGVQPK